LPRVAGELGATLQRDTVAAVDAPQQVVHTGGGLQLRYDALLVAVGATMNQAPAGTLPIDLARMGESLDGLLTGIGDGTVRRLAFIAPSSTWPLPVYELALLMSEHAREQHAELAITIVTAEQQPLEAFGDPVSEAVSSLLADEGIEAILGAEAEYSDGLLRINRGERSLPVDRVAAVPRLTGPAISGLPADSDGFHPVTAHCQVSGTERVYGAGDATTFPVKFGGIAAQQADAAAASIAALAGAPGEPPPFDGVVHGVILGGRTRRWVYFTARIQDDGSATDSRTSDQPTWRPAGKIAAEHLGPYLDERWAAGARWIAGQMSWEAVLHKLEERFGDQATRAPVS
jgi:sulfide:quinone oxidoreductase